MRDRWRGVIVVMAGCKVVGGDVEKPKTTTPSSVFNDNIYTHETLCDVMMRRAWSSQVGCTRFRFLKGVP